MIDPKSCSNSPVSLVALRLLLLIPGTVLEDLRSRIQDQDQDLRSHICRQPSRNDFSH